MRNRRLNERGELALLKEIQKRFTRRAKDIVAGIGDDCAVVLPRKGKLLLTTDMMVEGVHFDFEFTTYFQLGFKIISVNVSDIFAMGGSPRFVLLDIAAPENIHENSFNSFLRGVEKALRRYRITLVGGDLSASEVVAVSATVIGYTQKPVLRSGARPGDRIYVTGNLGDSACGLELLKRIGKPISLETGEKIDTPLRWSTMRPLLKRHLLSEARSPFRIASGATAMIDISDGLFIDLYRLCEESRVGARIYITHLPLSVQMIKAASFLGKEPHVLATSGGEDYELLFTAPADRRVNAACIGEITNSARVIVERDGSEKPLSPEGYQHWH
ncbi:MAG TPA: thiamine-phosphate kinase [Thermodesulfovibrionales bacterium]|nr:thiamine-phosphate kinase [Thermodesulfovibrionales bacterium]